MKKILPILLLIVIVVLVLLFLGSGLGFGNGSGIGEGDGVTRNANVVQEDESETIDEKAISEESSISELLYVKVTVSGGDYFYDNEKIKLDDLISKLKEIDGDYTVEVIDDQATKNAYDDLLDALDSNSIEFVEK